MKSFCFTCFVSSIHELLCVHSSYVLLFCDGCLAAFRVLRLFCISKCYVSRSFHLPFKTLRVVWSRIINYLQYAIEAMIWRAICECYFWLIETLSSVLHSSAITAIRGLCSQNIAIRVVLSVVTNKMHACRNHCTSVGCTVLPWKMTLKEKHDRCKEFFYSAPQKAFEHEWLLWVDNKWLFIQVKAEMCAHLTHIESRKLFQKLLSTSSLLNCSLLAHSANTTEWLLFAKHRSSRENDGSFSIRRLILLLPGFSWVISLIRQSALQLTLQFLFAALINCSR